MPAATSEDIQARFQKLKHRRDQAQLKVAQYKGQLETKRAELAELVKAIREAGHDPKNLKSERDALADQIIQELEVKEREVAEVEEALAFFESKK